jgi:hypothetical protein
MNNRPIELFGSFFEPVKDHVALGRLGAAQPSVSVVQLGRAGARAVSALRISGKQLHGLVGADIRPEAEG